MACNSFLIRVHGRVLSWCLCRVSAAEVLEVRFLPRCFFLARCSQAQSLLRCRSALHTLRLLLRSVCWQSRHSVCVKESWFRVFINTVQHFKVHKDYKQDAGVCAAASSLSVYTTLHFFSCLPLSLTLYLSLSLSRLSRWWSATDLEELCWPEESGDGDGVAGSLRYAAHYPRSALHQHAQ